jgi:hypothetical protein
MTDDDVRVRLCVRVADAEQWTATAVVETCGRCRHPVFVDRVTSPDPPGLPAPLAPGLHPLRGGRPRHPR